MAYSLTLAAWARMDYALKVEGMTYDVKSNTESFIYCDKDPNGKAANHIHAFERCDDDNMIFTTLLTKASSFRGGAEPDLANIDLGEWANQCRDMDSQLIKVVDALERVFRNLSASRQVR